MYVSDLHIHSRFSMATSQQLTLPHLAGWAMCKGIHVLGTGDFTHPAWQAELKEQLEFDESSGFYRLRGKPDRLVVEKEIADARPPFFCLQTEISSIYKRGGRTRRVHNLVFFQTLDEVERFSRKLGKIGNIESDGRPILGLDAHDLLDLVLGISDKAVFIPAHIWTPWYALFGSKSGFDAIEDCFGDLTPHIFALETGLSSDPAMNRLLSALDGFALISNSDAHSGPNLGREANLFRGEPSYDGMFAALRRAARRVDVRGERDVFEGTLEIYPEEGKYHLDGHRACNVVMTPEESAACGNICPVCGKPLTIGVLHRVWELADRREQPVLANEPSVHPIIPLPTVLAEIHGLTAKSKKVEPIFREALENLGSEFDILAHLPLDRIAAWNPVLGEAIRRIRQGELELHGGYDGEFGTIAVFSEQERAEFVRSASRRGRPRSLVQAPDGGTAADTPARRLRKEAGAKAGHIVPGELFGRKKAAGEACRPEGHPVFTLSSEQEQACAHRGAPLLVLAGPGSGKTRLLTERIVRLLESGLPSPALLALTFSRKAGEEILERVRRRLGREDLPWCGTFHALAWKLLRHSEPSAILLSDAQAQGLLGQAIASVLPASDQKERKRLAERFWLQRERCERPAPGSPEEAIAAAYARSKRDGAGLRVDFADLLEWMTEELDQGRLFAPQQGGRPGHVLVDEIQDLSRLQIRLLAALLPSGGEGFFGIGDPDQSIYGFRGASRDIVSDLRALWPSLELVSLKTSFRSGQKILDVASQAMHDAPASGCLTAANALPTVLTAFEAPNQAMEEHWVADQIAGLVGATSHTLLDEQKEAQASHLTASLAPSEIAVLVRLKAQIPSLARALRKRGVPVQTPSLEQFWQDEAVRGILAFMQERIGTGRETFGLAPLLKMGRSTTPPAELVSLFREQGLFPEGVLESEAWQQLGRAFAEAGSWEKLFEEICWLEEVDLLQARAESVRLLTMHAAKGLEFRAVFLPGFNDGLMPLSRPLLVGREEEIARETLEEERRLLYVALTRASEAIFLSWAAERHLYQRQLELVPSRFFADIETLFARKRLVRHVRRKVVQKSLLSLG